MEWESALGSVIEVAISLAGFSGIVAAVGRRGAGDWTVSDQLALRILLTSSGAAIFFSYLPFILVEMLQAAVVWRLVSALAATWLVGIMLLRFRQSVAVGITGKVGLRNPFILAASIVVIAILIANSVWFSLPSLYLVGMLWMMAVPFMTFVALLLSSWRPASNETPPSAS